MCRKSWVYTLFLNFWTSCFYWFVELLTSTPACGRWCSLTVEFCILLWCQRWYYNIACNFHFICSKFLSQVITALLSAFKKYDFDEGCVVAYIFEKNKVDTQKRFHFYQSNLQQGRTDLYGSQNRGGVVGSNPIFLKSRLLQEQKEVGRIKKDGECWSR